MKKLMILLLLGALSPLSAWSRQQTDTLPQWVTPFVESSHSIIKENQEILNQDFSCILADKRVDFLGYIGKDCQKMELTFQTVNKETNTTYLISGFSTVLQHIRPFSGFLQILDVRELNEYGTDGFRKGQIHKHGICIARYTLREEQEQKDSGVFSGISVFRWYMDKNDNLHYDDTKDDADSYSNNLFAGIWHSNAGNRTVKCAWGHYRIPDCGDLDIGTAEFSVNPAYAAPGWEKPQADGWYGYYSAEVNLQNTEEETEAGFVIYGIHIQPGECTYYKSQLHANDMYTCKVIAATADSIAFQATGPNAPDTDGKPLATLYRKSGRLYLSGPFVFDKNGNTDVPVEIEKKGESETLKECRSIPKEQVHSAYKIIPKESGAFYCLSVNGKEYRVKDMFDYGEVELKVYADGPSAIVLTELRDTYESVYFVYYFNDGTLVRLGQFDVTQPDDVEIHGSGKIALKVYAGNDKVVIESYLNNVRAGRHVFPVQNPAGSLARTDTMRIENKKTAIFIVPTEEEVNRIKRGYRSPEDFHTIADEAAFHSSEAKTYLKQNDIEIVYADTTCRILDFAGSYSIDLSDTAYTGNSLFYVILYNGYLPAVVSAVDVKAEAPDFFGLSLLDIVDKKAGKPESTSASLRITVPNDLDSIALLKKNIEELSISSAFQSRTPVTVYDSVCINGQFIGKGIPSSVKLYKKLPDAGNIKVILFAHLRECHNDSYPALELQTFDSKDRFIDRLLVSTSVFEEGGLYRYTDLDTEGYIRVTDVIVTYDMENDTEKESRTTSCYVMDDKGFFIEKKKTNQEKYTGTSAGQDFSLPIGSKWLGEYELSVSLGRINDSTEVFADYMISIDRDSASFTAGGYKIYCSYQGTVSEQDGRLIILCDKLIDGSGHLTAGDTLAILTFKAGNYYIESSIIYDNPDTGDSSRHLLTKTSQP